MSDPSGAAAGDLITSDDVIEYLMAEPLLRRKASTCVLRAVRVGAEWRFRRSDLEQWIAHQRALAAGRAPACSDPASAA